jgi:hypothetical protein
MGSWGRRESNCGGRREAETKWCAAAEKREVAAGKRWRGVKRRGGYLREGVSVIACSFGWCWFVLREKYC